MLTLAPLLLGQSLTANQVIDRLQKSHASMSTFAVQVAEGTSAVVPTRILVTGDKCRLAMPNLTIVEVFRDKTRFYDTIFGQVAVAKNDRKLQLPDDAANTAFVQRLPIGWLLQKAERDRFFEDAKRDKGWKVVGNSLVFSAPRSNSSSEIVFDKKYRVTDIRLKTNKKLVSDWRFRYIVPSGVESIPATARNVPGLPQRPNLPSTSRGPLVFLCQNVWAAMSRSYGSIFEQKHNGETFSLHYSQPISESSGKGKWSYGKGILTLPNGKTSKTNDPLVTLRKAGIEVSPVGRYVLNGQIPFLDLFNNANSVEQDGSGNFGGRALRIIKIVRGPTTARLYVDNNNRVAMMSSDVGDQMGSRLTIQYR